MPTGAVVVSVHVRHVALCLVAALALVSAPPARAGGDFVDLAAGGGRVWFVGPVGVRSLDPATGRDASMPRLVGGRCAT